MNAPPTQRYPDQSSQRDRWVLARRPPRNALDPRKPYASLVEEEAGDDGSIVSVATIFLTNRECPWRCVMCDLWKNTLTETVPPGGIAEQIETALRHLPPARHVKLYNSGSFFDPAAIPPDEYATIAQHLQSFDRVIVESHPALVGDRCLRFRDLLGGKLEVAMGLETAHPEVLRKLNKRMTPDQFSRAAEFLERHRIDLRVFLLVHPPFMPVHEAQAWVELSIDFAFDHDATAVSLIPTRIGNGAMEALAAAGEAHEPKLHTLEAAHDYGVRLGRGRVFADLWDLERFSDCPDCFAGRRDRLHQMNLRQAVLPRVKCSKCGA